MRHGENDSAFLAQAAQIVVDEVESLERRIRAFSEFAAEPPVRPAPISIDLTFDTRMLRASSISVRPMTPSRSRGRVRPAFEGGI